MALAEGLGVGGQQLLQVGLDAVLDQAGVDAELVLRVVQDLVDGDDEGLVGLVADGPDAGLLLEPAGRAHPVERLVGAVVGVDGDRSVGLDQQQPGRHREVSRQPADVVHLAAGDDEAPPPDPTDDG